MSQSFTPDWLKSVDTAALIEAARELIECRPDESPMQGRRRGR